MEVLATSGQAFRILKLDEKHYAVPAGNSVFIVEQTSEGLFYDTFSNGVALSAEEFFRTNIQLVELESEMKSDRYIDHAYATHHLIPLVQQPHFETVVSFIISANKNFPHICQCVQQLCSLFGEKIETPYGDFHSFPTPERLATASLEELTACKVGYRAPYVLQTAKYIAQYPSFLKEIETMSDTDAIVALKTLLGVGDKVADCILLFSYARDNVVPYDVWLHRIMQDLYNFPENTPYSVYRAFNEQHFGKYAGWVQQTLFFHARKVHKQGVSLQETWFK